ncbi:copper fist DNA-binding transcription factor [Mucor lusitanicus]|uniref:Copper fist DNA-binding transcription factor n=2 Tax=Mucor circinelloides f. lusitanicus TaxID=29924 RepID=A0A162TJ10_MUCCL|nr:copper fist DNA-binding transcription factor [Mucor lusitanicus]OAD04942.1 copper fist DNA-binding transcription factor [Mucor lusitanicus CBS 277.49]
MVILINGEKYACASCIRGHRVKKCNHNDRQLVPIVKRGRQISQCNHCRDLRKTNGTHVKCTCAIASTPNPINGCLCEVINSCSCVASHLQEVRDDNSTDGSVYSQSPSLTETFPPSDAISSCHTNINKLEQSFPPFPDHQQPPEASRDTAPLIDDADLMSFLENDLDKYLTAANPGSAFVTSTNIPGIN